MATVKPFRALRFTQKAGDLAQLVCPPYDIISDDEHTAYLGANNRNVVQLELPRSGSEPYAAAGEALRGWLRDGYLARDGQDGLYIYEEEFTVAGERKSVRGLTCRVRLHELDEGIVLPHEETLSKAKVDRLSLLCSTRCNISAIYSLYFDSARRVTNRIDRLTAAAPDECFATRDGVVHRVWRVYDPAETAAITADFADKKIYIADGHHRYETALNYRRHLIAQGETVDDGHPANYIMMTLVTMENPGLVIFPTHRVVHSLPDFDMARMLAHCVEHFSLDDTTPAAALADLDALYKQGRRALAVYDGKQAKLLVLKDTAAMRELLPNASEACRSLDVNVLHLLVLERALGIDKQNLRNQQNLTYTRSAEEALAAVDRGEANCCFLINPTRVEEIAAVAEAGEKMPQKSTYFYPKLITGYVMNPLF